MTAPSTDALTRRADTLAWYLDDSNAIATIDILDALACAGLTLLPDPTATATDAYQQQLELQKRP